MPFKANAARRHHIPKQKHRVSNWAEYDACLRARGSLTVLCGRPERGNGFRRGSMRQSARPGMERQRQGCARLRACGALPAPQPRSALVKVRSAAPSHGASLCQQSDHRLIAQSPASVSKRHPGLSPPLSWQFRTRTTSHSVGAHGSRTTIPLTADRAQGARPFSCPAFEAMSAIGSPAWIRQNLIRVLPNENVTASVVRRLS